MNEKLDDNLNLNEAPLGIKRKSITRSRVYSSSESSKIGINNPYDNSPIFKKRESEASFERLLNDKLRKEQEEEKLKHEVKLKKNLIKKSLYVIVTVSSSFFIKEYIITLNNSK